VPFQRDAWLRLYGIPLHALNELFVKIYVLDCGRYLHTNSCTLDKGRFDYARVLIATSNLEVVNIVYKVLIDGVLVEVKIIEECGFNWGEDACLFEDDDGSQSSHSDHADIQGDLEACNNVDTLVKNRVNRSLPPCNISHFRFSPL